MSLGRRAVLYPADRRSLVRALRLGGAGYASGPLISNQNRLQGRRTLRSRGINWELLPQPSMRDKSLSQSNVREREGRLENTGNPKTEEANW